MQRTVCASGAAFGFSPENFAPTYRLLYGTAGRSLAIEIAARLGMPKSVIAAARENRTEPEKQLAEHLARVGQCSVIAPPEPDTVTAWLALRSCVVTGAVRGFMSNSSRCASPYGGAIAFLPLIARQRLCARRR